MRGGKSSVLPGKLFEIFPAPHRPKQADEQRNGADHAIRHERHTQGRRRQRLCGKERDPRCAALRHQQPDPRRDRQRLANAVLPRTTAAQPASGPATEEDAFMAAFKTERAKAGY